MNDNKKPVMLSFKPRKCVKFAFKGPFIRVVSKKLVIRNPSKTQSVAFKLKTTTPRLILVLPRIGILGPNQKVKAEVFMRPVFPEADQKGHMILVQGAVAPGDITKLEKFWKVQKSDNIWDAKIQCKIVPCKSSNERLVQAAVDSPTFPDTTLVVEHDYDVLLANLRKVLEEDRLFYRCQTMSRRPFYFVFCLLTIVAAIACAFYSKHDL